MAARDWDENYEQGFIPWDTDEPDPNLVETVRSLALQPGRALDVGCGTGTHAVWLGSLGFEVVGVDLSERAIERAEARAESVRTGGQTDGSCTFVALDFLTSEPPGGPFDFVFDRGCFHVFDEPAERATFAKAVAACLAPDGYWLSLIGSTEGPPREFGPPRRTARAVTDAIEPVLELLELRSTAFDLNLADAAPRAWACLSRRRSVPAQPSSVFAEREN
ncbi:MAG TPA: class I SAM-dependent methyltransferase [Aeromicrobium sp.]|nr:class I SAM-dependent methyltransferase [Aeromicrobium sp.]